MLNCNWYLLVFFGFFSIAGIGGPLPVVWIEKFLSRHQLSESRAFSVREEAPLLDRIAFQRARAILGDLSLLPSEISLQPDCGHKLQFRDSSLDIQVTAEEMFDGRDWDLPNLLSFGSTRYVESEGGRSSGIVDYALNQGIDSGNLVVVANVPSALQTRLGQHLRLPKFKRLHVITAVNPEMVDARLVSAEFKSVSSLIVDLGVINYHTFKVDAEQVYLYAKEQDIGSLAQNLAAAVLENRGHVTIHLDTSVSLDSSVVPLARSISDSKDPAEFLLGYLTNRGLIPTGFKTGIISFSDLGGGSYEVVARGPRNRKSISYLFEPSAF